MQKVFVIEGLIGSGKSTILKQLERNPDICCIYEPVDKWVKDGVLQEFYTNLRNENPLVKSLSSYKFQTYAYVTRLQSVIEKYTANKDKKIFVLERSLFSDKYFFTEMLYEDGVMNKSDYDCYLQWWNMWQQLFPFKINGFIYLKTDVNVCMSRCANRNRDSESAISEKYQESLKHKHDQFFTGNVKYINSDIFSVDILCGNTDLSVNNNALVNICSAITEIIYKN